MFSPAMEPFVAPQPSRSLLVASAPMSPDVLFLRSLLSKRQEWPEDKLKIELLNWCLHQDDGHYSTFSAQDSSITDTSLKVLCSAFRNTLQVVDLRGCRKISREGLSALKSLVNLRELNLSRCAIGSEDLECLRGLKHLRTLRMSGLNVQDSVVDILATLEGLEELDLSRTKVTQRGLAMIAASPVSQSLTKLNITGTPAAVVVKMTNFAPFTSLRTLHLGNTDVEILDLIKLQLLSQHGVVNVSISATAPAIEIQRSTGTFTEPSSAWRAAPAELVMLLEKLSAPTQSLPAPALTNASKPPAMIKVELSLSPRRSPRLAKKMQSISMAQSIATPMSRRKTRHVRSCSDEDTDKMQVSSPLRAITVPLPFNLDVPSPSKKSNLKKRTLLEAFGDEAPIEQSSKRARRVSFAGFQPSMDENRDENIMDVDSPKKQSPIKALPLPFGQRQTNFSVPLNNSSWAPARKPGLFGTLQGLFF